MSPTERISKIDWDRRIQIGAVVLPPLQPIGYPPDGTVYASYGGGVTPEALYAFAGDGTGLSTAAPWPTDQANLDRFHVEWIVARPPRSER